MDEFGYPTEDELEKIEKWSVSSLEDFHCFMAYINSIWTYADCGYWSQKGNVYSIATAGWSGNEDIVSSMKKNVIFWLIYWQQSTRGGKYIFCPIRDVIVK